MLAEAVNLAIGPDRNIDLAVKLIHAARELASEDQSFHVSILAMAAMEQVSLSMLASGAKKTPSTHTEYGLVQSWFKKNHADLVPGSSLEKIKAGRYMPDFMLKMPSGRVVPVECKKTFNARSLRQLQAYMDNFDSDFGCAVGCRLDVELPENVVFSPRQKTMIDVAIRDGLRAGLHYKQIYALAKDRVSLLVPLLPKS